MAKAVNVSACLKSDFIFFDFSVRKAIPVGMIAGSGAPNKTIIIKKKTVILKIY